MFASVLSFAGKMGLLIALGYYLRRKEVITGQFQKEITAFLINVALPASILLMANAPKEKWDWADIKASGIIGCVCYAATWLVMGLISKTFPLSDAKKRMFSVLPVFANNTLIGVPLVLGAIGAEGYLSAITLTHVWNILFYIGAVVLIRKQRLQLKTVFTSPAATASVLAVILYLSPFRYPLFFQETLALLSNLVMPISMLMIGCSFTQSSVWEGMRDPWSYVVVLLRHILIPMLVLTALYLFPGIPNAVAVSCCLMSCVPCSALCAIYAQKYDCAPEFAICAVVQSQLFMVATIPPYWSLVSRLFPLT